MNSPACNAGDMRHKGTTAKRLNSVRKIGLSHLNCYRPIIFESNIPFIYYALSAISARFAANINYVW